MHCCSTTFGCVTLNGVAAIASVIAPSCFFVAFFTLLVLWVVYEAQFGGESSTLGTMARKWSSFVLGGLVNGVGRAAQELAGEL